MANASRSSSEVVDIPKQDCHRLRALLGRQHLVYRALGYRSRPDVVRLLMHSETRLNAKVKLESVRVRNE